jgi:hypothetical protein
LTTLESSIQAFLREWLKRLPIEPLKMYYVIFRITYVIVHCFQGASVPAAPTMAAAEAEAAEAAAAPPVAELELTAEQEDLLASFLSDVTQVF